MYSSGIKHCVGYFVDYLICQNRKTLRLILACLRERWVLNQNPENDSLSILALNSLLNPSLEIANIVAIDSNLALFIMGEYPILSMQTRRPTNH